MKVSLHLQATHTDAKQTHLQSQRQFDALLDLIKRYNLRLESTRHTVSVTYDIEVVMSDEVLDLNPLEEKL